MSHDTADLNAEAARLFPREWAQADAATGKKRSSRRHTLRKRAAFVLAVTPLREAGHSCADCRHWKKVPHGPGHHCSIDSDFHGYTITDRDDICEHWKGPGA